MTLRLDVKGEAKMLDEHLETIQHVFVDEAGGTELSESLQRQDFYVICGVLVPTRRLEELQQVAGGIVRTHCGLGELKSSQVGSNTQRRQRLIENIAEAQIPFYCLVVDKTRIYRDSGLHWRGSFYKFLHRMFYARIKGVFTGINVIVDRYGSSKFMNSFEQYFSEQGLLFNSFRFQASAEAPLLQIADFIAGTVRRIFLGKDKRDLIEKLVYSTVPMEVWPPMSSDLVRPAMIQEGIFDHLILRVAVTSARDFVESCLTSEDEDEHLQAHVLRYLLLRLEQNPTEYVHRAEITSHIKSQLGTELTDQALSQRVFAPARDEGVLLSSTDSGVKIPACQQDIEEWIRRTDSQVVPYLQRLEKARKTLLIASENKYDIVTDELYPKLAGYLKPFH